MELPPDYGKELKARLNAAGMTQRDLADFLGVDHRAVFRIVSGERKRIPQKLSDGIGQFFSERLPKLQASLSVTLDPFRVNAHAGPEPGYVEIFGKIKHPKKGWRIFLRPEALDGTVREHPLQRGDRRPLAVKVIEDNMSSRYEVGEVAYAVEARPLGAGKDCLVRFSDGTAQLLQFVKRTDTRVFFRQFNPPKTFSLSNEEVELLPVVGRAEYVS